jgi:DNA-binding transcriptional LysR family regulator
VNIGAFDLNLLVVFDALLTDRSVTRAAERLGLSQPALSNALARLRDAVGDRLFERTRDGMQPTPRALAMAVPVGAALKEFGRALTVPPTSRLPERRVTIGANSYAQCVLLPRVIRLLRESATGVTLDVRSLGSPDVALTVDWTSKPASNAPASEVVIHDPFVCVARERIRSGDRRVDVERPARHRARQRLHNEDYVGAVCLALQSDVVATAPRRLAEWFARRVSLRISKPPEKLPDAVLRVSWSDGDGDDPGVITTRLCVLEAGVWLAQGSRK